MGSSNDIPSYEMLIAGHAEPNFSIQDLSIWPSPLSPKARALNILCLVLAQNLIPNIEWDLL